MSASSAAVVVKAGCVVTIDRAVLSTRSALSFLQIWAVAWWRWMSKGWGRVVHATKAAATKRCISGVWVVVAGVAGISGDVYADTYVDTYVDKHIDKHIDKHADTPYQTVCRLVSQQCVDGPATRTISHIDVHRDCWRFDAVYDCRAPTHVDDCAALRERGCGQVGSTCISHAGDGRCLTFEQKYQCVATPARQWQETPCEASTFCQDGVGCFDTSRPDDQDFASAAVMMEVGRQAGVYGVDPKKVEIFKGMSEACSVKVLGSATIKSCCTSSGGGAQFSNYALLSGAMKVGGAVGKETFKSGSKYVFDGLYQKMDPGLFKRGLSAMTGWDKAGSAALGSSFKLYGFSFSFTFANGFQFVAFDPYSFALSVGLILMQQWLQCNAEEQAMSLKRGQNLCSHVETRCVKNLLGVCIEREQSHCCFNSKLAKIVNRQGRSQLGLSLGRCDGFNESQLKSLDFSKMDLSEFIADIAPQEADLSALQERARGEVGEQERRIKNYYDKAK